MLKFEGNPSTNMDGKPQLKTFRNLRNLIEIGNCSSVDKDLFEDSIKILIL
jgi:hypothetical protein